MRRVAAAALAALLLAACSGGGGAATTSSLSRAPVTADTEVPATTTTEPPLVGQPLVVAEQGVSSFPDPFDPQATLGGYGVVLQNPDPALMATGVRVTTRILDPAGVELLVDKVLVNGVMPGQRMAVGRTLIEPIASPTQLDVHIEVSGWLHPAEEGALTADGVVTEPEPNGGAITRFTVHSTWPVAEDGVDVTALYRALDGRILGAESTSIEVPVNGDVPGQIRLLSPIPDLASTEVFVGRGIAAQTIG